MGQKTCETPGHESRPGPYTIDGRRACRSCRNKHVRESDPSYVRQKPGPKPDPTRANSRYNPESRHHRGGVVQCGNGHKWAEGSYKVRSDGKKVCLLCIAERKGEMCPEGHERSPENTDSLGRCKVCARTRQSIYRLKAKYGLIVEQLEARIAAQDGRCAICHEDFDFDLHNGVCVDHDHACCPDEKTCGKCLRGILCGDCNQGLGRFKDSPEILYAALGYVEQWSLARK